MCDELRAETARAFRTGWFSDDSYQYKLTDHLGNTVVFFADHNDDGILNTDPASQGYEVLQRNLYYPFGAPLEFSVEPIGTHPSMDYLYNGKELDNDLGLNWYAYGARFYDASIGRFTSVDPIAAEFAHVSVFNYAENRVPNGIDLWGLQYVSFHESLFNYRRNYLYYKTNSFQSGVDNGQDWIGTSIPYAQMKLNVELPPARGRYLKEMHRQADILSKKYKGINFRKSGLKVHKVNRKQMRDYQMSLSSSIKFGKMGGIMVFLDLTQDAYNAFTGINQNREFDRQLDLFQNAFDDVVDAYNDNKVDEIYLNQDDFSALVNFVFQGTEIQDPSLAEVGVMISSEYAKNYIGGQTLITTPEGMDNYPPIKLFSNTFRRNENP